MSSAPSVPLNLTYSNVTKNSFVVSWDASSDERGVDGYNVYINGVFYTYLSETILYVGSLSAGTSYDVTVSAYNGFVFSDESSPLKIVTRTGFPATNRIAPVYTTHPDPNVAFNFTFNPLQGAYEFWGKIISLNTTYNVLASTGENTILTMYGFESVLSITSVVLTLAMKNLQLR